MKRYDLYQVSWKSKELGRQFQCIEKLNTGRNEKEETPQSIDVAFHPNGFAGLRKITRGAKPAAIVRWVANR